MSKNKLFTLDPNPTFTVAVSIPRPGESEDGKLSMTFRHHPIDEFAEHMASVEAKLATFDENDPEGFDVMVEAIMHIAIDWGFSAKPHNAPFTEANVRRMLVNYPRSFGAIHGTYYLELMGLREKN